MTSEKAKINADKKFSAFLGTLSDEERALFGEMMEEAFNGDLEILGEAAPDWYKGWRRFKRGTQYTVNTVGIGALGARMGQIAGKGSPWAMIGGAVAGAALGFAATKVGRFLSGDSTIDKYLEIDKKKDEPSKSEPKKDEPSKAEPKAEPKKDEPKKAPTATKPTGKGCPPGKKMIFGMCRPCKGCD